MTNISTHVLDISRGLPVVGLNVILHTYTETNWVMIARGLTNKDGRITNFKASSTKFNTGRYQICFDTEEYFRAIESRAFYPSVEIKFIVENSEEKYHIPLLISPFGYSTYRGS